MPKFIILSLFLGLFLSGCSYSSSESSGDKKISVCSYAQIEIQNKLKSPSSAKHPSCSSNTYISLGSDKYKVSSYVDAKNSFGASVRTQYECTVTLTDSDVYYINCNIL